MAPNTGRSRHMCEMPASMACTVMARLPRGACRGVVVATATEKITQPTALSR